MDGALPAPAPRRIRRREGVLALALGFGFGLLWVFLQDLARPSLPLNSPKFFWLTAAVVGACLGVFLVVRRRGHLKKISGYLAVALVAVGSLAGAGAGQVTSHGLGILEFCASEPRAASWNQPDLFWQLEKANVLGAQLTLENHGPGEPDSMPEPMVPFEGATAWKGRLNHSLVSVTHKFAKLVPSGGDDRHPVLAGIPFQLRGPGTVVGAYPYVHVGNETLDRDASLRRMFLAFAGNLSSADRPSLEAAADSFLESAQHSWQRMPSSWYRNVYSAGGMERVDSQTFYANITADRVGAFYDRLGPDIRPPDDSSLSPLLTTLWYFRFQKTQEYLEKDGLTIVAYGTGYNIVYGKLGQDITRSQYEKRLRLTLDAWGLAVPASVPIEVQRSGGMMCTHGLP